MAVAVAVAVAVWCDVVRCDAVRCGEVIDVVEEAWGLVVIEISIQNRRHGHSAATARHGAVCMCTWHMCIEFDSIVARKKGIVVGTEFESAVQQAFELIARPQMVLIYLLYVHMHSRTCTRRHTRLHEAACTHKNMHIRACMCTQAAQYALQYIGRGHACTHECMRARACLQARICMCTCVHGGTYVSGYIVMPYIVMALVCAAGHTSVSSGMCRCVLQTLQKVL